MAVPYFRLSINLPDDERIAAAGEAAAWLYVVSVAHCQRQRTDGFVPESVARRLVDPKGIDAKIFALLKPGPTGKRALWEKAEGGYQLTEYLEMNDSRAEIERKEGAHRAAQARYQTRSKSAADASSDVSAARQMTHPNRVAAISISNSPSGEETTEAEFGTSSLPNSEVPLSPPRSQGSATRARDPAALQVLGSRVDPKRPAGPGDNWGGKPCGVEWCDGKVHYYEDPDTTRRPNVRPCPRAGRGAR